MLARRLLLLAAVLLLMTALAAGLAPGPDPEPLPAGPAPSRTPDTVEESLSADLADQSVQARVGDLVRLEVSGDVLDAVEIEQLDRIDAIEPTTPARFELITEQAGVFPIRLIEADRRIGRLDVRP
jgi:hypothetical protein